MKKTLLLAAVLLSSFLFYTWYFTETLPLPDPTYKTDFFYLGGIQINEANNEDWMAMLKKSKMNTVEVTIYAEQGEWDSDSLRFATQDDKVMAEIRAAKKEGIKVVLILRVSLDFSFERNKFIWHGMIMPKTSAMLDRWFAKYKVFANHWAQIAEQEGVDVFSVGSEMNALSSTVSITSMPQLYTYYNSLWAQNRHEKKAYNYKDKLKKEDLWLRGYDPYSKLESYIDDRIKNKHAWSQQVTFANESNSLELMNARRDQCRTHWKSLIKNVRGKFKGKLTYAANFDNYMLGDFWGDLDFIGINAYFGLTSPNKTFATAQQHSAELKNGWERVFTEISTFRVANGWEKKPLFFTELGYINREHATVEPWGGFGYSVIGSGSSERLVVWAKEKEDLQARKLAINALYDVVKENNINLEGLLYWKLTTHDYHLPYEPFALHLTPNAKDSLQISLGKFSNLPN
jgi:hypothetical protein